MSASAMSTPEETTREPGTVVTFYSYKGGTGRSMALANVAWLLASAGYKVLVIDWDLEAPGLHRYFAPFLPDRTLAETDGLIDLVIDFASEVVTPPDGEAERDDEGWYVGYAERVLRYAVSLDWPFPDGGLLDFLPAGRQSPTYSARVNSFDWQHFYEKLGGGAFIEAVRDRVRALYDVVLIDSRTGVSDTSGICTVQMPDALVACFTLNNQGIEGAAAVAESVYQQRRGAWEEAASAEGVEAADFSVFPVPMRVEMAEKEKRGQRWDYALRQFAAFPLGLTGEARERYWREVSVRYDPYYAYEEILAFFGDKQGRPNELLDAAHRLAEHVVGHALAYDPPSEEDRTWVLAQFEKTAAEDDVASFTPTELGAYAERIYVGLLPEQQAAARRLLTPLCLPAPMSEGLTVTVTVSWSEVEPGSLDTATQAVAQILVDKGLLERESGRGHEVVRLARHDLVAAWPRLAEWVDADGEFLQWRRRLAASLGEWEEARSAEPAPPPAPASSEVARAEAAPEARPAPWAPAAAERGLLLSGKRLARAQHWFAHRGDELSEAEREYIRASERAAMLSEQETTRVVEARAAEVAQGYRESIKAEYTAQARSAEKSTRSRLWAGRLVIALLVGLGGFLAVQQAQQRDVADALADSLRTVSQVATLLADAEEAYAAGRPDSAFATLSRAGALSPDNPLVTDREARFYERATDTTRAVQTYLRAADLYLAAGDTTASLGAWERALRLAPTEDERDRLLLRFGEHLTWPVHVRCVTERRAFAEARQLERLLSARGYPTEVRSTGRSVGEGFLSFHSADSLHVVWIVEAIEGHLPAARAEQGRWYYFLFQALGLESPSGQVGLVEMGLPSTLFSMEGAEMAN